MLGRRDNEGLRALMDVARLDHPPTMHTLGFVLGPRLNAGGRLGRSDLGVQILTSTDSGIAETLALQIDQLNTDRRAEEAVVRASQNRWQKTSWRQSRICRCWCWRSAAGMKG